jgi:hypothetical protein
MLRSVEITAVLSGPGDKDHLSRLYWQRQIELSLDCFVCERVDRTTFLEWGAERAICTADEKHGRHFTAARIASFDVTSERESSVLRSIVDFWWAPFEDAKRGTRALPLGKAPWVRLHFGYYCPFKGESGKGSIQTNLVRPCVVGCMHCETEIANSAEAPTVRLLA